MAATFVPGLQLAREFHAAEVRPLLAGQLSEVPHAAALIGPGSEVAGFDTERSADHDWGPRLQVFLGDSDAGHHAAAITSMRASRLLDSRRRVKPPADLAGQPGSHRITRGFHVLKRCWVVERTFGWLMLHRRLARDYETPGFQF